MLDFIAKRTETAVLPESVKFGKPRIRPFLVLGNRAQQFSPSRAYTYTRETFFLETNKIKYGN